MPYFFGLIRKGLALVDDVGGGTGEGVAGNKKQVCQNFFSPGISEERSTFGLGLVETPVHPDKVVVLLVELN